MCIMREGTKVIYLFFLVWKNSCQHHYNIAEEFSYERIVIICRKVISIQHKWYGYKKHNIYIIDVYFSTSWLGFKGTPKPFKYCQHLCRHASQRGTHQRRLPRRSQVAGCCVALGGHENSSLGIRPSVLFMGKGSVGETELLIPSNCAPKTLSIKKVTSGSTVWRILCSLPKVTNHDVIQSYPIVDYSYLFAHQVLCKLFLWILRFSARLWFWLYCTSYGFLQQNMASMSYTTVCLCQLQFTVSCWSYCF